MGLLMKLKDSCTSFMFSGQIILKFQLKFSLTTVVYSAIKFRVKNAYSVAYRLYGQ